MKKNKKYERSSGNVFADLKLSNPEERLAKAELAYQINHLIQDKGLTQHAAAQLLGIDQPKISALNTGHLAGFSIERLFRFLNTLGQDITIKISPKKKLKTETEIIVTTTRSKYAPRSIPTAKTPHAIHARKKINK